jgi:hypothetical protein
MLLHYTTLAAAADRPKNFGGMILLSFSGFYHADIFCFCLKSVEVSVCRQGIRKSWKKVAQGTIIEERLHAKKLIVQKYCRSKSYRSRIFYHVMYGNFTLKLSWTKKIRFFILVWILTRT